MVEAPFGDNYTNTYKEYHGTKFKGIGVIREKA